MGPHPEARVVAEHGQAGVERAGPAVPATVPAAAAAGPGREGGGDQRVGRASQRNHLADRPAVYDRRRPDETVPLLPSI